MAKTDYAALMGRARELQLQNDEADGEGVMTVPVAALRPSPHQPRQTIVEAELAELVASVREHGVLFPVLVRPSLGADGTQFELVAGERRWRAAQQAGLTTVMARVVRLNDEQARLLALTENLNRRDLNPLEETEAVMALLMAKLGRSEEELRVGLVALAYTQGQKFPRTGSGKFSGRPTRQPLSPSEQEVVLGVLRQLGRVTIKTFAEARLPILDWPETIREHVRQGRLPYTHALSLARLPEPQQTAALTWALAFPPSKRELLAYIQQVQQANELTLEQRGKLVVNRLAQLTDPEKRRQAEGLIDQLEQLLGS
jgi:ParB family transcriptional regulator, chromosome partitioning protein